MRKTYQPINCSFHDVLLAKATLREVCQIVYWDEKEREITLDAIITDVFTRKGEEFMHLNNGIEIRLDAIVSVAGQKLR